MKLHDINTAPVEVKGGQAINLQMDTTSAIGFSLSIDKLYTHKIESVVREICSNARDSMISAGRGEIPFEVFLPSVLSPYLVIKDTGLGLSKEDAITYLSTLYKSTKTNENQSVGSYGIGSKSPFAISDSYNIETIKDGRKCAFQFFRSGRSLPQLMLLNEEDTDEPNGVTFRIHVRDVDQEDYRDALQTQLFMFDPKPLVDGLPWNLDAPKIIRQTPEYTLYRSEAHRDFFGRYAVEMGGVTYPFKPNEVDNEFDNMVSAVSRDMSGYDIMVFHMPIGEVEVPGDRERIEYSDWTKKNLKLRLDGCFKDYFKSVREGVEQLMNQFKTNPLEILQKVKDLYSNNGSMIRYMIEKGELSFGQSTDFIKVFSQPVMNFKGELSEHDGIGFSLGQASSSDFKLKLPLEYAKKTVKRRSKDSTGVEKVEDIEVYVYKYSTSHGNYDHNSNLNASRYQDAPSFTQGEYSNKYRQTKVILIDQRDKPYLKLVGANLKAEERNNIIFVRCNGDDIDFTAFEEAFKFFECDAELIRLSSLKLPTVKAAGGKLVPVRFSASGIRKVEITTSNWYGQQKARNPIEKLKSEEFDDFKPEFYAFFDSNNDRLYFDAEMTRPLPESKIEWLRRVAMYQGSNVVFLSKTTAKTLLSHYQDMGAAPLSDLLDIGKCYQMLSREEKNILFNFVRFYIQTERVFSNVYDKTLDYNMRVLFDLRNFHNNESRYYHNEYYVSQDSILTFLRNTRVRNVEAFKAMEPSPEFMKQIRNVLHVMLNRSYSGYVKGAIDNMTMNIIHAFQKEIYKSYSVEKILDSLSDELIKKHIGELLGDTQSIDVTRFLTRCESQFGNRAYML